MIIETISAYRYYGKHATGGVVLVNGYPEFHGSWSEVRKFKQGLMRWVAKDTVWI
jgi:hypothetical protein